MGGAILRRRDRTDRPLRMDHYSAAVNRMPAIRSRWPRLNATPTWIGDRRVPGRSAQYLFCLLVLFNGNQGQVDLGIGAGAMVPGSPRAR